VRRSYQGSKQDWFTIDLPQRILTRRKFPAGSGIFDRNKEGSIYHVAVEYLEGRCQMSAEEANALIEAQVLKMKDSEATVLIVPKNPSDNANPMIYLKEVRQFVPIGNW
jgi:hypothetical protein